MTENITHLIPARSSPGLTRTASPTAHQGEDEKCTTGTPQPTLPLKLKRKDDIIIGTWNDTFRNVENFWLDYIEKNSFPNLVKFLVGNKADSNERVVDEKKGRQLAYSHKMLFIETSAKFGINVNTLFHEAAKAVLEVHTEKDNTIRIELASTEKVAKKDCIC
ncbi:Ras- protein RABE1d [Bulinus truncatus]|nr:Ras- protein RABE1d [Bulinus truncatus]